jgi:hypothetical protein
MLGRNQLLIVDAMPQIPDAIGDACRGADLVRLRCRLMG